MMDKNLTLVTAGVTAVSLAAAYVLFGLRSSSSSDASSPGSGRRRRLSPGTIPGLVNSGNTCFVNSLLQALAALPNFYEWVRVTRLSQTRTQRLRMSVDAAARSSSGGGDGWPGSGGGGSLVDAVSVAVTVLNDHDESFSGNVYNPTSILDALRGCGWVIAAAEEQDLHEFFLVLLDTIGEDAVRGRADAEPPPSIRDAFLRPGASEDVGAVSGVADALQLLPRRHTVVGVRTKDPGVRRLLSCPSLKRLEMPFQGLLASQLICTTCSRKTALRHDPFFSVSLAFPAPSFFDGPDFSLVQLLRHYFSSDTVVDVHCSRCTAAVVAAAPGAGAVETPDPKKFSVKRTFVKNTSIGKLPKCLCLHIQRTCWLPDGRCVKRRDPVDFPEYLDLEEFVFTPRPSRRLSVQPAGGGTTAGARTAARSLASVGKTMSVERPSAPSPSPPPSTLYQLKSVVEHLGDVSSGHFVTYRRGPIGSDLGDTWFYTSDARVQPTTRSHVHQAVPYILFYERLLRSPSSSS